MKTFSQSCYGPLGTVQHPHNLSCWNIGLLKSDISPSFLWAKLQHPSRLKRQVWWKLKWIPEPVYCEQIITHTKKKKEKIKNGRTTQCDHVEKYYLHVLFRVLVCTNGSNFLHLTLNHKGHWGTTDDFSTYFLHFSLFSTALWDLANSRSVHSLMLSSRLFFCLPCLLPSFTVPCKMVLVRPDEWKTCPYPHNFSLCLFTMVRRSLCGLIACWILAQTSSLVMWSLYEMPSMLGSTSFS